MNILLKQVGKIKRKTEDGVTPKLGVFRRKKLISTDFSIISNNCWGGMVYRYFDLPYTSPTVGLYFFPGEYLKLVRNLPDYCNPDAELRFIKYTDSRYADEIEKRGQTEVPIGLLNGDVEIVFLHYPTEDEAKEKWFRRVRRLKWSHLMLKFSQMNGCSGLQVEDFLSLDHRYKICLVNDKRLAEQPGCIYYHVYDAEGEQITNDTDFPFAGMNIYKIIDAMFQHRGQ